MAAGLSRGLWILLVFLTGLAPRQVRGQAVDAPVLDAATTGYQEAVHSQVTTLIQSTIKDFFAKAAPSQPDSVSVDTKAEFDFTASGPQVRHLDIKVVLATAEAPALVRQARQAIIRTLRGNGYRFEGDLEDSGASLPLASLSVDVLLPKKPASRYPTKTYLIFAALVGGSLLMSGIGLCLLLWPWRRQRQRLRTLAAHQAAGTGQGSGSGWAEADALPPLPPGLSREPKLDLPPLPRNL